MRATLLLLLAVGLLLPACSDEDSSDATTAPPVDPFAELDVCNPGDPVRYPDPDLSQELRDLYLEVWETEFKSQNGIDDDWFEAHVSDVSATTYRSPIAEYFRVAFRVTIDWAVMDEIDQFPILFTEESGFVPDGVTPDEYLTREQVLVEFNSAYWHVIGPVSPLEHLEYDSCSQASQALQDSASSTDIMPRDLAFRVPGMPPRQNGELFLLGFGTVNWELNQCIEGRVNLSTGEWEAWSTPCRISK